MTDHTPMSNYEYLKDMTDGRLADYEAELTETSREFTRLATDPPFSFLDRITAVRGEINRRADARRLTAIRCPGCNARYVCKCGG